MNIEKKPRRYQAASAVTVSVWLKCIHNKGCLLIISTSGQIFISWSSWKVAGSDHKPIYILMSMTLDGSVERAVLNDAKRKKVLSPIKGGRKPADYDLW